MPLFTYRCAQCGYDHDYLEWKASTTYTRLCPRCDAVMARQPSAPNFTIKGFSDANGYSKGQ